MLRLPAFTYLQPKTLDEALRMKADAGPDGAFVAGGTDLYPNMKRRQQEPTTVISLMEIPELRATERRKGGKTEGPVTIGACLTLSQLSVVPSFRRSYSAVVQAAGLVSTPLLRNMGTLGGNLCLDTRCNYYDQTYEWRKAVDFCMKKAGTICWVAPSSPRCWAVNSSDVAPVMVALGADYRLVGPGGERIVPAARFYENDGIAYLSKQPDEILADVRLPAPDGWDAVYHKLRRRGSFDFPVLGVAVWIRWSQEGRNGEPGNGKGERDRVADARIVLGGVASRPQEVPEAGAALRGSALEDAAIAAAAEAAYRPAKPLDNTDFDLSWRKQMTRVWVTRAIEEINARRR
jgi:4-hydroxybenzoyl-CoA reductase subunit beta